MERSGATRLLEGLEDHRATALQLPDHLKRHAVHDGRVGPLAAVLGGKTLESASGALQRGLPSPLPVLAVPFLGRRELVRNKKATGRTQDLADLAALNEK